MTLSLLFTFIFVGTRVKTSEMCQLVTKLRFQHVQSYRQAHIFPSCVTRGSASGYDIVIYYFNMTAVVETRTVYGKICTTGTSYTANTAMSLAGRHYVLKNVLATEYIIMPKSVIYKQSDQWSLEKFYYFVKELLDPFRK